MPRKFWLILALAATVPLSYLLNRSLDMSRLWLGLVDSGVLAAVFVLIGFDRRDPRRWLILLSKFGGGILILALLWHNCPALLIYGPANLLYALTAYAFGSSLLPGREPLIARFARLARGEINEEIRHYARRVTILWTLLLAGLTLVSLTLIVLASLDSYLLFATVGNYIIIIGFFLAEYGYRRWRFRHYPTVSLSHLLKTIAHQGIALAGRE